MFLCTTVCAAILPILSLASSAAPASLCQSPNVFGTAWLMGQNPATRYVWVWPSDAEPRFGDWVRVAAETCTSLPAPAGVVLHIPAIVQALAQGPGSGLMRQILFRLGVEHVGEARLQMRQITSGLLRTHASIAWPRPRRGPVRALGAELPVQRPAALPAQTLGFGVASVSAGRAWQEFQAFAGGLWPLEAALIGTQITAWEQGAGNGELAEDIFGYQSVAWTVAFLAGPRKPSLAFILGVAKPKQALSFARWALQMVAAVAPSIHTHTEKIQGQTVLAVKGLLAHGRAEGATLYLAAGDDALLASTQISSIMQLRSAKAVPISAAARDPDAPKQAVAFAQLHHAAFFKKLCHSSGLKTWLKILNIDPKGATCAYLSASESAYDWRISSATTPVVNTLPPL